MLTHSTSEVHRRRHTNTPTPPVLSPLPISMLGSAANSKRDREDAEDHGQREPPTKRFTVDHASDFRDPLLRIQLENLAVNLNSRDDEDALVELCRALSKIDDSFEHQLGRASNPPCKRSLMLERDVEGNFAATQACAVVYRDLAKTHSSINTGLAHLLSNLHQRLLERNRQEEALAVVREYVAVLCDLAMQAKEGPWSFHINLASVFHKLSSHLSSLGRQKDILVVTQEFAIVYRDLTKDDSRFNKYLVEALQRLSSNLLCLGRPREVPALLRELIEAACDPAKDGSREYDEKLTSAFQQLSNVGRQAVLQQRITVHRNPAQDSSDSHQGLTSAFNCLSSHLSELNRQEEALAVAEGSVAGYRDLVKDGPGHWQQYNNNLADALKRLCSLLSDLGRQGDALVAAEEAIRLTSGVPDSINDEFNSAIAALISAFPSLSSYPNLQRYLLNISLALAAKGPGGNRNVTGNSLSDLLLGDNSVRASDTDADPVYISRPTNLTLTRLTIHDEGIAIIFQSASCSC